MNRVFNIAQTGNIAEPTPVDNIMAQMPQEQNFWQKAKNFAGSTLGRNLIGGLATAAAVGLSGGDTQDALRYGVIGAGNTMDTINRRKQYENQLLQQQQDRADKLAEAQAGRDFQMQMADKQIAANKEAADLAFERRLQELAISNQNETDRINLENQLALENQAAERQRKIDNIQNNPMLTDDQKMWAISNIDGEFDRDAYFSNKLVTDPQNAEALTYFANKNASSKIINPTTREEELKLAAELSKSGGLTLDPESLNSGQIKFMFKPQNQSEAKQAYDLMVANGVAPQEALVKSGLDKFGYNTQLEEVKAGLQQGTYAANAGVDYGYQTQGAYRDQGIEQENMILQSELNRRFEEFKNSLPTETQRNIKAQANALGVPESAIYQTMFDEQQAKIRQIIANIANTQAGTNKTVAETQFIAPQAEANLKKTQAETAKTNQELSNLQDPNYEANKELAKQRAKNQADQEAERQKTQRMMEEIRPRLERTLAAAKAAAKDGTGLGQVAGRAPTLTEKGGRNRAAIATAQTQMNTAMRAILTSMGVGSSEMNSGVEAAAYRYQISPEMEEPQILATIESFEADYMDGNLQNNLQGIANKIKSQRQTGGQIPTDDDAWGGI